MFLVIVSFPAVRCGAVSLLRWTVINLTQKNVDSYPTVRSLYQPTGVVHQKLVTLPINFLKRFLHFSSHHSSRCWHNGAVVAVSTEASKLSPRCPRLRHLGATIAFWPSDASHQHDWHTRRSFDILKKYPDIKYKSQYLLFALHLRSLHNCLSKTGCGILSDPWAVCEALVFPN